MTTQNEQTHPYAQRYGDDKLLANCMELTNKVSVMTLRASSVLSLISINIESADKANDEILAGSIAVVQEQIDSIKAEVYSHFKQMKSEIKGGAA